METACTQNGPEISTALQEKFASGVKGRSYLHAGLTSELAHWKR